LLVAVEPLIALAQVVVQVVIGRQLLVNYLALIQQRNLFLLLLLALTTPAPLVQVVLVQATKVRMVLILF
jgi:hypothetical protein